MMTTTSYLFALIIYWLSAALGCRLLYRMWFQRLSPRWAGAITGLCAGILLAPSYAATDISTLAPALITGVFNLLFAGGMDTALGAPSHAVRGCVFGCDCWSTHGEIVHFTS
jgi:membrane protease YdiL (CAAX protease family)